MEHKKTLIVGASGATGRLVTEQFLSRGLKVKVVVRSPDSLPEKVRSHENLTILHASLLELSDSDMEALVNGCGSVISCLGHTLSFKGLFGPPHRLVTDATSRLSDALQKTDSDKPIKFILMNTTGNSNRDLNEPISFAQKCVLFLLRHLLPPHADNENATDFLRTKIGQNHPDIEWTAVRPDGLTNEQIVTGYKIYASPIRSAIFDAGKTSRINVAHFMAELATDQNLWNTWKGRMPVIYNKASPIDA